MTHAVITGRRSYTLLMAIAGTVVPAALALLAAPRAHHTAFDLGALGCCVGALAVTSLPTHSLPRRLIALGGLVPLTMMQAYTGGAASGYIVLMMMAMVWFGLEALDRDVVVMIAMLAACAYLPMLLFGAPAYPIHWVNATLLLMIGTTVAGSLRLMMRHTMWLNERLREEAIVDPLTGLLNRRGWARTAEPVLERARRTPTHIAGVAIDLDDFKRLNDTAGHHAGDRVLRETADRLRKTLRASDVIARLGGDELGALLTDTAPGAAVTAVQRLLDITPADAPLSAGIAVWSDGQTLEDLMQRADDALYAAKAAGGGRAMLAPGSPTGGARDGAQRSRSTRTVSSSVPIARTTNALTRRESEPRANTR